MRPRRLILLATTAALLAGVATLCWPEDAPRQPLEAGDGLDAPVAFEPVAFEPFGEDAPDTADAARLRAWMVDLRGDGACDPDRAADAFVEKIIAGSDLIEGAPCGEVHDTRDLTLERGLVASVSLQEPSHVWSYFRFVHQGWKTDPDTGEGRLSLEVVDSRDDPTRERARIRVRVKDGARWSHLTPAKDALVVFQIDKVE
jgi:hypothetical protein